MPVKPQFKISLEAIRYQGKSLLLHDLRIAFEKFIKTDKQDNLSFSKLGLDRIVKRHTGLAIDFKFIADPAEVNAMATPPILDLNSPLLDYLKHFGSHNLLEQNAVGHAQVLTFSKDLRGQIDRKTGKVSGIFSKIPVTVMVGQGLWKTANLSADEVAAVLLHELGHVFSFFEVLTQTATTNVVLQSAVQALRGSDDEKLRLKLVFETAGALGVTLEDPKALAQKDVKDAVFTTVFLKAIASKSSHSAANSAIYDLRAGEFLADQFAARHGGGRALVTGLDKIMRNYGGTSSHSGTFSFMFMEAIRVAGLVLVMLTGSVPLITLLVTLLFIYLVNPYGESKVYDDPLERVMRIRQDLIQSLKKARLSHTAREQLLKDIEQIDAIRDDLHDRRSWLDYLWVAMTARRRGQFTQMRFQQEIERLVNNDLFLAASKFKSMAM